MATTTLYCKDHTHLFEYVCTHCKSILCPQCLDKHPKHNNLFNNTTTTPVHLLNYAKATLRPHYSSAIKELTEKGPELVPQLSEARGKLKEVLMATILAQEKLKAANKIFEAVNDELSYLLAKIEFAEDPAEEVRLVESEWKEFENSLRTANISGLIKMVKNEESALARPRLAQEDLEAIQKAFDAYQGVLQEGFKSLVEEVDKLAKCAASIENEIKVAGKQLGKPPVFKEFKKEEVGPSKKVPYDTILKNAISANEVDQIYSTLTQMRKDGLTPHKILKICFPLDHALFFLLSYAFQQKQINPEDELLTFLGNFYEKAEARKDPVITSKFQSLVMKEIIGYEHVKDILKERSIRAQDKRVKEFIKQTPKDFFTFSKKSLDQYLGYMEYQSRFAYQLARNRLEWAKVLLGLDSVLKVAHYANQIPSLQPDVDKMSKKIEVPKKHMAIIRLKAFGQAQDWKGFVNYINKEKPKLPSDLFAEICIIYKNKELAVQFIRKIPDYEVQMNMFLENESYVEAAEAAVLSKRPELTQELKARVLYDIEPYIKEAEKKFANKQLLVF
eukprot:TRINITY_DN1084_c0_g1_i1.p2 TRINITY_DN1084_c0_g1~~TRINITY_DN1084_c0_g1_i1.p2  ORF type:complete len:560 (-),score=91.17 TRINITY_DN1084_c0_g1_i1:3931-5610(-)